MGVKFGMEEGDSVPFSIGMEEGKVPCSMPIFTPSVKRVAPAGRKTSKSASMSK